MKQASEVSAEPVASFGNWPSWSSAKAISAKEICFALMMASVSLVALADRMIGPYAIKPRKMRRNVAMRVEAQGNGFFGGWSIFLG